MCCQRLEVLCESADALMQPDLPWLCGLAHSQRHPFGLTITPWIDPGCRPQLLDDDQFARGCVNHPCACSSEPVQCFFGFGQFFFCPLTFDEHDEPPHPCQRHAQLGNHRQMSNRPGGNDIERTAHRVGSAAIGLTKTTILPRLLSPNLQGPRVV